MVRYKYDLVGIAWYMLWPGEAWHGIWYVLAGMARYMVWPGGHGMVCAERHGMVYGMAWRAWHGKRYGLAGMA